MLTLDKLEEAISKLPELTLRPIKGSDILAENPSAVDSAGEPIEANGEYYKLIREG